MWDEIEWDEHTVDYNGVPEDGGVEKYRDDYDEDYLTLEERVTGHVRVEITSFDGYGASTSRFVDLTKDNARDLGQELVTLTSDITAKDREHLESIRERDNERLEAESHGIIGGARLEFDLNFLLRYIDKLEGPE